ncbi:FAD-dependent monooxygenase [Streptomyces fuscichromogenes]|uniref:FAD-dependent monooxygenase n=1 Tax=Streptomyces fuscichromogenes TaxID=1324013 RepID=UPI00382B93BB
MAHTWALWAPSAVDGIERLGLLDAAMRAAQDDDGVTGTARTRGDTERFHASWLHGYARSTRQIDPAYGAVIPQWCEKLLPGDEGYGLDAYRPYRMDQRAATTMRAGRVLPAGDSAHATNPIGSLGLTSGLFDTFVLHDALAADEQAQHTAFMFTKQLETPSLIEGVAA